MIEAAPDDEHERERELEDQRDEMEHDEASFAQHFRATAREINIRIREIELTSFHSEDLDLALNRPIVNAGEGIADPAVDDRLQRLENRLDAAMRDIARASEGDKKWNTEKYIAASTAILAVGVALADIIYQILSDTAKGKSDSNVPTDEDTKAKIRELIKKWNGQSDADYWNNLALYVEKNECSVGDQILFMNYTIDLYPGVPWIWETASDKADMVDRAFDLYTSAGSETREMYKQISSFQYKDVSLPRPVAADVLRYALVRILVLND
jgi:hypothetical protein